MQDPNQAAAADPAQDDPAKDKRAKVHRIQTDLAILDSDLMKNERSIEDLKLILKKDKHEKDRLEVEIEESEKQLRKLEGDNMIMITEIRKLRKKMNLLT